MKNSILKYKKFILTRWTDDAVPPEVNRIVKAFNCRAVLRKDDHDTYATSIQWQCGKEWRDPTEEIYMLTFGAVKPKLHKSVIEALLTYNKILDHISCAVFEYPEQYRYT